MTKRILAGICTASALVFCTFGAQEIPALHPLASDFYQINDDAVGWLRVPGTDIDEVVVQNDDPDDANSFYYRRDSRKQPSMTGCYYADFRCRLKDGITSRNVVIYGHTLSDDPDGVRFGQLLRYKDADFAAENPVVYFSTLKQTYAWEVFAVSVVEVDAELPYNDPNPEDESFLSSITAVRANSVHPFEQVEVGVDDTILTFSTVDYSVTGVILTNYRYVVMARLIDGLEQTPEEAPLTTE